MRITAKWLGWFGVVVALSVGIGCSDSGTAESEGPGGPYSGGESVADLVGGESVGDETGAYLTGSCEGVCGDFAPNGCSCQESCLQSGNCCANYTSSCDDEGAPPFVEGVSENCLGVDLSGMDTCCDNGGHCVGGELLSGDLADFLEPCASGGFCAPDDVLMATGSFVPLPCASLGGPGVCMSMCIPMVAEYAAVIPQDVCQAHERCAPCINPLDGQDLGICGMELMCAGDGAESPTPPAPPVEQSFAECMGQPLAGLSPCCDAGNAHCLEFPAGADLPPIVSMLDGCAGGGYCIPDAVLNSGTSYTPKACASIGGSAGSCLSACIPKVAEFADLLPVDVCEPDERCSPCIDPFTGEETGGCGVLPLACGDAVPVPGDSCAGICGSQAASGCSCAEGCEAAGTCCADFTSACSAEAPVEMSCDNPPTEPVVDLSGFSPCCPGAKCLPNALVPADFMDKLDICDGGAGHCIPDKYIETAGFFTNELCNLPGGIEGRCLSTCLPDVAAQADLAPQATCQPNERCIPCCDPFTGEDLGFCGIGCDPGMADGKTCEEDAVVYGTCCGDQGACLPTELIPPEFQENLKPKECGEAQLCTPTEMLDPDFFPSSCQSGPLLSLLLGIDYTGVCLPDCIEVPMDFLLGKGSCNKGEQCIPCEDPLGGGPTGAPGCP